MALTAAEKKARYRARHPKKRATLQPGEFLLPAFPKPSKGAAQKVDGRTARKDRLLSELIERVNAGPVLKKDRDRLIWCAGAARKAGGTLTTEEWCKAQGITLPDCNATERDYFWARNVAQCGDVAPGWVIAMLCHLGGHIDIHAKRLRKVS